MARGRKVVQGVAVGVGLLGAVLGGALAPPAHDLSLHSAGIRPMAVDVLEPAHPEHGHDEHHPSPPHEFLERHHVASATGVNVVPAVSGGRAESSGPGLAPSGASIAAVPLTALSIAGAAAAARRMRASTV